MTGADLSFLDFDTRLGAYVFVRDDSARVLLARVSSGDNLGRWTLPGGAVDLHETVDEAAIREARAETGLQVALDGLLAVTSAVIPADARRLPSARPLKRVNVIFSSRCIGGTLTPEIDETTDGARWFSAAELQRLTCSDLVHVAHELSP